MSSIEIQECGRNKSEIQELSRGDVVYSSIVAFVAWLFAVYDYSIFGTILPLISKDFGWSEATTGQAATWVSVGVFFISLTVGPMIDYIGRKKAMVVCCVGAALSSLLAGFATGIVFLIVVRALSGFGYSEQAVNSAYLNELYGAKRRGFWYGLVQGGWPLGVLFGAAMTAILEPYVGWREMFWVATFPAIVIAVLAIYLKESPQYHAMRWVRTLHKSGQAEEARELGGKYGIAVDDIDKSTYTQLFSPGLRRQTIALMLAFVGNWCAVAVFVVLGTTILTKGLDITFSNSLLIFIVSNLITWVGFITMGFVGDIIGRKATIGAAWLISPAIYCVMLFLAHGITAVFICYAAGLFFLLGPYSALFTYMGESFPARVRGTGLSIVNAMGPIGAILGSALYAGALGVGASVTMAALIGGAIPVFLGGLIVLFVGRAIKPGQDLADIAT